MCVDNFIFKFVVDHTYVVIVVAQAGYTLNIDVIASPPTSVYSTEADPHMHRFG